MEKILQGILFLLVISVGVAIAALILFLIKDEIEWSYYATEHNCVEYQRQHNPDQIIYIWDSSLNMMMPRVIPQVDTVWYRCDGGQEIKRG